MAGMIAIFMSFAGQFAFFTYIRPVYMNLAGFGVDGLTLVLLSFGIASFIGTSLSSFILKRSVKTGLSRRAVNTGSECVGADVVGKR
ncbi:ribonucleoside transporter [Escherichia coli]|uniref:Ribonucleoside transporter n=1 Tax=Escherichia coli TaxID=562 RepID=A0A377DCM3_ECOLX|nr:ribonucleoside transporter [Escherichia coli]